MLRLNKDNTSSFVFSPCWLEEGKADHHRLLRCVRMRNYLPLSDRDIPAFTCVTPRTAGASLQTLQQQASPQYIFSNISSHHLFIASLHNAFGEPSSHDLEERQHVVGCMAGMLYQDQAFCKRGIHRLPLDACRSQCGQANCWNRRRLGTRGH